MRYLRPVIFLLALSISAPLSSYGYDNLLTIHRDNYNPTDVASIQKIVLQMVMGLHKQDPYLVYMHYQPDPLQPESTGSSELDNLKQTLANLFLSFSNRTLMKKPYPEMTATFDFIDQKKDLSFSSAGSEAWMDLEIGFYTLPGDPAALSDLPADKLNAMSTSEKEMKSRFRTARLNFKKIEGVWYLTSLNELDNALKTFIIHYRNVEADPHYKAKK